MTATKNTTLKCTIAALFIALAACGKKENSATPEKTADTIYQVRTITTNGLTTDSFVYINNQIRECWKYDRERTLLSVNKSVYTYGTNGLLVHSRRETHNENPDNGYTIDSIAWLPDQIIIYSAEYSASNSVHYRDTAKYRIDNNKNIIFNGDKNGTPPAYEEFIYTGNNMTTQNEKTGVTQPNGIELTAHYTLEYGNLVNPLYTYFINNPIVALKDHYWDSHIVRSQNNLTKRTATGTIGNSVSVSTTILPGTNYVSGYVTTNPNRTVKVDYTFNKVIK